MDITPDQLLQLAGQLALENRIQGDVITNLTSRNRDLAAELERLTGGTDEDCIDQNE